MRTVPRLVPSVSTAAPAAVVLTVSAYNDARVRAAIAGHQDGAGRNGNLEACREIAGLANPAPGTRINSGDSRRVSVTPARPPARRGGRPPRYASPAEGNRARQRAYRARRAVRR